MGPLFEPRVHASTGEMHFSRVKPASHQASTRMLGTSVQPGPVPKGGSALTDDQRLMHRLLVARLISTEHK